MILFSKCKKEKFGIYSLFTYSSVIFGIKLKEYYEYRKRCGMNDIDNKILNNFLHKLVISDKENLAKTVCTICGPVSLILLVFICKKWSLKELIFTSFGEVSMIYLVDLIKHVK